MAGHNFATYTSSSNTLVLHTTPPASLFVPPLALLFALSAPHARRVRTLVGVTTSQTILFISAALSGPTPSLTLLSETPLPVTSPPKMILPVDPMAWVGQLGSEEHGGSEEHDVLLSVSEDGELAFWVPDDALTTLIDAVNEDTPRPANGHAKHPATWKCTGKVRTGRKGLTMARCSSAKKSVLGLFDDYMHTVCGSNNAFSCADSRRGRADYLGFEGVRVLAWDGVPPTLEV